MFHNRLVRIADRWPDHPAMGVDRRLHVGFGVVGVGGQEVRSEGILTVVLQHRNVPVAIVADQQGTVVGEELGEQAEAEQHQEYPQRPVAAFVGPEDRQAAACQRREVHDYLASKSMRGSTTVYSMSPTICMSKPSRVKM